MPPHLALFYTSFGVSCSAQGSLLSDYPLSYCLELKTLQLDKELGWTLAAISLESLLGILVALHRAAPLGDVQRDRHPVGLEGWVL